MSQNSFLDKIGHCLAVGLKYAFAFAQGFVQSAGPAALAATGIGTLEEIGILVQEAESVGEIVNAALAGTGTKLDKAALIAPAIEQAVLNSQLLAGKKIISQPLFQQAIAELNNGVVDLLKSVEGEVPAGAVATPANLLKATPTAPAKS
jgi:hypothetical protein